MKENEQNFDDLKKLLQLKRHEVPPPGYFNSFSDKVIARIQAGEAAGSRSGYEQLQAQAPWLAKFIALFEAKPSVIAGFATALCLLVVLSVVLTEKAENATAGLAAGLPASQDPTTVGMAIPSAETQLLADGGSGIQISTNPISLQPVANLFGQQNPLVQSVSFAH